MLIEAISQVSKLKIDAAKNQHQYYSAVLDSIELKLREVYKGLNEDGLEFAEWLLNIDWEKGKNCWELRDINGKVLETAPTSHLYKIFKDEQLNKI